MKAVGLALALGAALFLFALPAAAATVGVTYSGKITSVDPEGAGQFAIGDTFTFHVEVDDTSPDTEPTVGAGVYFDAITKFTGSFSNGYHFAMDLTSTGDDRLFVGDNASDGLGITGSPFVAPQVNTANLVMVTLSFYDPTGTTWNSEAIPGNLATILASSTNSPMFMQFAVPGLYFRVQGVVTAAVATTPIPAALPLLMSALGGLGFVGWRRRRVA